MKDGTRFLAPAPRTISLFVATISLVACGKSHGPGATPRDGGVADSGGATSGDAACTPHQLAPGVLGGACCPAPYRSFALVAPADGGYVESGESICWQTDDYGVGGSCAPGLNFCGQELVCSMFLEGPTLDGRCLPSADCAYARSQAGAPTDSGACYYGDLTPMTDGIRPTVTCSSEDRRVGLCGTGCDCPRTEICVGASEVHPTGVCAPNFCDPTTTMGGRPRDDHCMFVDPAHWPDFWRERAGVGHRTVPPPGGYIVTREQCDALEALYPGLWRCLAPDEVYTP